MVALIAEPDSPDWFKRFVLRMKGQYVGSADITRLQGFKSTSLPNAAATPYALIAVTDKGVPAYSDGTYWYPIMVGVHY